MAELDEFYTVKELAKLLKVTQRTVYRLVERGELPVHSFGRAKRFSRADVEDYIERSRSHDG